MRTFRNAKRQCGLTLIEMMIAMLIGVFLMAGAVQVFSSAKQAYLLQENLSRLQENGRFAMDILTKDIRMAGFSGCSSKKAANNIATPVSPSPNPATLPTATVTAPTITPSVAAGASLGINGAEGQDVTTAVTTNNWNNTAYPAACGTSPSNQCIAAGDVISIQSASSCGGQLTGPTTATQIQISANNTCKISANDVLIISNCSTADIFVANNVNSNGTTITYNTSTQNNSKGLSATYGTDAEILNAKLISYYIRKNGSGVSALYRIDNTKIANGTINPEELIEGIENMQILYGVDNDQTADFIPDYYVRASEIPATIPTNDSNGNLINPAPSGWTRVVSVRISLLAVTIDDGLTFSTKTNGTETAQSYFYNDQKITPTDRKIRRVFSSTIAIRNRLP